MSTIVKDQKIKDQKLKSQKNLLKPELAAALRQHLCHRRSWPVWLTADEVAELLRVDIGTVYSLARQNILPHVKIGRIYRFDRDGMFYMARTRETRESRKKEVS